MPRVIFNNSSRDFYDSLKKEVDEYFSKTKKKKTGNWRLFLKTGILIPSAIVLFTFLLVFNWNITGIILLSGLLGFILASIGFNVMHDACHGSYSTRKWVNDLLGLSLNVLGGNAFIWKQKHNIIHHTYTNVDGLDDDIAKSPLIRHCETQVWKPFHRVQHLYLPFVYALTSFLWTFVMDFQKYFSQKVYVTPLKKMTLKEHVVFWLSKVLYVGFYILIPLFFKGGLFWLLFFSSMHFTLGMTLALVFQLAHVVEKTEFEKADAGTKHIDAEWAVYQVRTTANFATNNKLISWYVGGLNFQVEHHLFPKISHIHYPALSKIVKKACQRHKLPYHQFPTMWSAVVSHFRTMKLMGKKPAMNMSL